MCKRLKDITINNDATDGWGEKVGKRYEVEGGYSFKEPIDVACHVAISDDRRFDYYSAESEMPNDFRIICDGIAKELRIGPDQVPLWLIGVLFSAKDVLESTFKDIDRALENIKSKEDKPT